MSSEEPKWKAKADITYEQLCNPSWNIPHIGIVWIARELEKEYGKKKAHEIINNATKRRPEFTTTKNTPEEIIKEWRKWLEPTSPLMSHVLETEFEDVSPTKFKQCVTDCLFARAFKGMDAGDIGYLWECNTDYESARRFHPNLKMKRNKTIMQGDDHCNFTYYWEEE
jgi:hypothetical protein